MHQEFKRPTSTGNTHWESKGATWYFIKILQLFVTRVPQELSPEVFQINRLVWKQTNKKPHTFLKKMTEKPVVQKEKQETVVSSKSNEEKSNQKREWPIISSAAKSKEKNWLLDSAIYNIFFWKSPGDSIPHSPHHRRHEYPLNVMLSFNFVTNWIHFSKELFRRKDLLQFNIWNSSQ